MANAVTKPAVKKTPVAKREPSFIEKAIQYVKDSWAETKRATWPSWLEIRHLTIAVFVAVAIVAIYIYGLDTLFATLTGRFLGVSR